MWRPKENWDAKEIAGSVKVPKGFLGLELYVEAGADAMLEALKNQGTIMNPEQMELLAPDRKFSYGWLVFIPDEK